jgi:hypothetical protein
MSFNSLLTHTVSIYPLGADTGIKRKYTASPTTGVPCLIQPLTIQEAAYQGLTYGNSYKAFFQPASVINPSDKVVDQDGVSYRCVGIANRNYSKNPHKTVILTTQDA